MNQHNEGITTETKEEEFSAVDQFPASFAIFALARTHRGLATQLLREVGLFAGQEIMLMQLWDKDNQPQHCLGRTLRLDHSTVAKTVRRLEESGWVTRSRSEEDGRVTLVSLTQAGRDLESKVLEVWNTLENITVQGLSNQEKEQFVKLSLKIASAIDQL